MTAVIVGFKYSANTETFVCMLVEEQNRPMDQNLGPGLNFYSAKRF